MFKRNWFSRRDFLRLSGKAGAAGAIAMVGLPAFQTPEWTLTGDYRETCSCNMHCPCWTGIKELMIMDQGWCATTTLINIESGSSNDVDLSGVKLIFAVHWPGPTIFDGEGTGRLYIDEDVTDTQYAELETIFQGKRGGPMEILASITPTWLDTQTVKIEVTDEDNLLSATVDNFGQIKSQLLINEAGDPMTISNVGFTVALQFDDQTAILAPATGSEWTDSDMPVQWESKSGTVGHFTWSVN